MVDNPTIATWRTLYADAIAQGDLAQLLNLKEALTGDQSDAGQGLLQNVVSALAAALQLQSSFDAMGQTSLNGLVAGPTRPRPSVVESVLAQILGRASLQVPDGRPLYRYAVDGAAYTALKARLVTFHQSGELVQPSSPASAIFVMYVAEWFRREYDGGQYRWTAPLPNVIGELKDVTIKALARQGLSWWGLAARRMASGEMRLLSLVLEGGFPTRLLEKRERGRIAEHLRTLISRLELRADIDEASATSLSRTTGTPLGPYDHEEFHILCLELAQAVVALKRQADATRPPGVATSAWLDMSQPDWRDGLPIGLTGDGARKLLDDLVSDRGDRVVGRVGCRRLLVHDGMRWVPSIELEMHGEIDLPVSLAHPSEGRLQVFAAEALASLLAGELGLLDPPVVATDLWLSRLRAGKRAPVPFRFDQAAKVELRSVEGRRRILTWPRGSPLRSEMLVFVDPRGDDVETPPQTLLLLGGGSLNTKRQRVWLLTPPNFVVCPLDSDVPETPLWVSEGHIYETTRSVHAGPPNVQGYRIELGASCDFTHELAFDGPVLTGGASAAEKVTIFAGVPSLRLNASTRSSVPASGSVYWRFPGASIWHDWANAPPNAQRDHGVIEVVWRDPKSRIPLDRQRVAIVPTSAGIVALPKGERGVTYRLENLPSWTLDATSGDVTAFTSPSGLEVTFAGRPARLLALVLSSIKARLEILAPAPIAGGGFSSKSGALIENGTRVMLEDLRGAVAFSAGHEWLHLRGPGGSDSHIAFQDELPLWAVSEEILRLLSASNGLDDVVTLELGMQGRRLKVGRYAATLTITPERSVSLVPELASMSNDRLDWLSVTTGQLRVLSTYLGIEELPSDLQGPGIVIPRQDGRVVGRPTLVLGGPLTMDGLGLIQRATLISRGGPRRAVLARRLEVLAEDTVEAATDRNFLLKLINALDGVPPAAIDALSMLPEYPTALAALAAAAETEELLGKVWLLEQELPFLWAIVPLDSWSKALTTRRRMLERLLANYGFGTAGAAGLALSTINERMDVLAALDPMLRTSLALATGTARLAHAWPALKDAVQDRLRRTAEDFEGRSIMCSDSRNNIAAASCFRRPGSALAGRLPVFPFDDSFREGLDAPCAAALAAAARPDDPRLIVLDTEQVRRARDARSREPRSFADIYAACLSLLARGAELTL